MKKTSWKNPYSILRYLVLIFFTFITLYPFSLLVFTSLKTTKDYMKSSVAFPVHPQFSNFITVLEKSSIFQGFLNSITITGFSLMIEILFGALAAYALTKMNFKKAGKYQLFFLAPMILPIQIIAIPLYMIFTNIGLINSKTGIIMVYVATGLPLVIFMLTSFMKTIPNEISESAMVEGASEIQIFSKIVLPLLRPVIATITVISGLSIWNDFFMPLLLITNKSQKTLPLKIYDFMGQYNNNWPLVSTCIIYVLLPILILYIFLQKYIVAGVVAGAVKG